MDDDLLVPAGRTLRILPGTRIRFAPALSSKTEPAFWNADTELSVAGRLLVEGAPGAEVVFDGDEGWGGLVAAPGASVDIRHACLRGAAEGLLCVQADCRLRQVSVERSEYGIVLGPGARLLAEEVELVAPRIGVLDARGDAIAAPSGVGAVAGVQMQRAVDAAVLAVPDRRPAVATVARRAASTERVEVVGDYTVETDETWRGEWVLSGRVTVVPGAVLTLAPGTRVAFRRIDRNGDGLGEAELLVLGGIRSWGEPGRPVVFESAEEAAASGDWDKVSLIASEDADNVFRYSVFRGGVQALHAHFSRLAVEDCLFEGNVRALQFQESESTRIERCVFVGNKQALRFRDSRVRVSESRLLGNWFGVHAFRAQLEFVDNIIEGSPLGGLLAKECQVLLARNRFRGARDGVRMRHPSGVAQVTGNDLSLFAEDALSVQGGRAEVNGNRLRGTGLDLVSSDQAHLVLRGNQLLAAGRHAVHLKATGEVDARGNYWDVVDPATVVYDAEDNPALGTVEWQPTAHAEPIPLPAEHW